MSEQRWRSGLGNGIVPPEGGMQFYSRDPELYTRLNALEADLAAARKRIDELEFIMRGLELVGQKDNEYLLALLEAAERHAEQWRGLVAEAIALAKIVYADSKEAPYRRQAQSWLARYDALRAAEAPPTTPVDLREQASVRDTLRQPGGGEEYD